MSTERYLRQVTAIGTDGQERFANASVLVVGAGGLGSPLLFSLAGAGIGHISIVDGDSIVLSNLNRQFLYTEADIGKSKAACAAARLIAYNGDISVTPHPLMVDTQNAAKLVTGHDLVILAVDNLPARLAISDACETQKIPLIDGGIDGWYGTVLTAEQGKTPYLCGYYAGKTAAEKPAAIGAVASAVASLMANAALLMLLGEGCAFAGSIPHYDGRSMLTQHI